MHSFLVGFTCPALLLRHNEGNELVPVPSAQALAVTVPVSQALREENTGEETLQSCLEELLKLGPEDFLEVMELLKLESFKRSLRASLCWL